MLPERGGVHERVDGAHAPLIRRPRRQVRVERDRVRSRRPLADGHARVTDDVATQGVPFEQISVGIVGIED